MRTRFGKLAVAQGEPGGLLDEALGRDPQYSEKMIKSAFVFLWTSMLSGCGKGFLPALCK